MLVNAALNVWGEFGTVANGELKKSDGPIFVAGDFYGAFTGRRAIARVERKMRQRTQFGRGKLTIFS